MTKPKYKKFYFALAAPSGGGKTTLCHMLLKKYPQTRLSISYTTRAPRGQEQDGRDYYFVDRNEFMRLRDKDALAEWAEVHGNFYATGKKFLLEQKANNKIVLLDVDVQGVKSISRAFPEETVGVFILPPDLRELEARLRSRNTESEDKIKQRLAVATQEIEAAVDFKYKIVNKTLEAAFAELCEIFEREVGVRS